MYEITYSINGIILSFKPPQALTSGNVPYFKHIICAKPHGSKALGIKNKSLEA